MTKPVPLSVTPRQLSRPALAFAIALVGIALTSTPTPAQGATDAIRTCTTYGTCLVWGLIATIMLYFFAVFTAITGLVRLWRFCRRPHLIDAAMLACICLVVWAAAAAGIWVEDASLSAFSFAYSLPGAPTQGIGPQ